MDNGSLELPTDPFNPFRVYYSDHSGDGFDTSMLVSAGTDNAVASYHDSYKSSYNPSADDTDDYRDGRTFTYFINPDGDSDTDFDLGNGRIDAALVVIDDMGSPVDPSDDLLGNIGWWVENVADSGGKAKRITFALQFWYPGQERTADPEVIVIKTLMVAND